MNYFKILRFFQKGDKGIFDISVEDQKLFLNKLGEPIDDIDRGFKQYLCQNLFVPKWKVWLLNFFSLFFLPFVFAFFLIKGFFIKKKENIAAMIERKGMEEVVPCVVNEKYRPDNSKWYNGASMRFSDLAFVMKLLQRAKYHLYFVLKTSMNLAAYSDMIYCHKPQVLIQYGEFSFSSSILTAYCHRFNIKHIDIMHGEKFFFIRDAYFHYDECYVWGDYYVDLFKSLKADPTQFRIALPPSLNIKTELHQNSSLYADYKYYLGVCTEEELRSIVESMKPLKKNGKTIKFRPHPRYSDLTILRKYVSENEIEDTQTVGIVDSISNLTFAVGSYSTVLLQAWYSGKKVILDDVTFKFNYDRLFERGYILSQKCCDTLSKFQ